jgi:DNA-binding NarL/FixJ family response regulator
MVEISYSGSAARHVETVSLCWSPSVDPVVALVHPCAEDMRARLAEAMQTLRRLGSKGVFPSQLRSAHPDIVRLASESYGYGAARVQRHATAAEISRMDALLPHLHALPPDERQAATGVALGLSLRRLGRQLEISYETVRTRERDGINRLLALVLTAAATPRSTPVRRL